MQSLAKCGPCAFNWRRSGEGSALQGRKGGRRHLRPRHLVFLDAIPSGFLAHRYGANACSLSAFSGTSIRASAATHAGIHAPWDRPDERSAQFQVHCNAGFPFVGNNLRDQASIGHEFRLQRPGACSTDDAPIRNLLAARLRKAPPSKARRDASASRSPAHGRTQRADMTLSSRSRDAPPLASLTGLIQVLR